MATVKKRSYSSAVRKEQAAQTRARILEAAGELFESNGYARTTIAAIAERAGVAADTVYAIFGNKARVLTALIDVRLAPAASGPRWPSGPCWVARMVGVICVFGICNMAPMASGGGGRVKSSVTSRSDRYHPMVA